MSRDPAKKIYVGCSLTHAPEEFKEGVGRLKDVLRAEGHEILDFLGVIAGEPSEVFTHDIINCVRNCDAMIAICDEPSTGLGYEIGEAVNLGKPVLALAHDNAKVTRLVLGAAEVLPNVRFERYIDLQKDIIDLVNNWLADLGSSTKVTG